MKLLHVLGTFGFVAPFSLVFGQSQNETFITEEIANIPACGVSSLFRDEQDIGNND